MFKDFFLKKMLKAQGVPEGQVDMVLKMVNKNPELFKKIAGEIEAKTKTGLDQQTAAQQVMQLHQAEITKLMQEN